MALSSNTIVEVRVAGNDTNGGGFVFGATGTDYSIFDTKRTGTGANDSVTNAVANGTTTLTSATAAFTTAIIGNVIYLQGGTGGLAAGWYQVLTRPSATSITVDRTVAAGTGITMNIGGALGSPGMSGGYGLVNGSRIWIKAGTYPVTSATINISGGCPSYGVLLLIEGYENSRGDRSFVKPVLQASGIATATLFTLGTNDSGVICIETDGATLTAIRGFSSTIRANFLNCTARNCTNSGFNITSATSWLSFCWATGCTTAGAGFVGLAGCTLTDCYASANTVPGFSGAAVFNRCIAAENTGATVDGFISANQGANWFNCVAYGNGRDGFRHSTTDGRWYSCIAEKNGAFGYNVSAGTGAGCYNYACAGFFDTGTGDRNGSYLLGVWDFYNGSESFFVDAANGDFTLTKTGDGENIQNYPNPFPDGINVDYLDAGAMQHLGYPGTMIRLIGRGGMISGA